MNGIDAFYDHQIFTFPFFGPVDVRPPK